VTEAQDAGATPGTPLRTRDWVWGLVAAVAVGILVPMLLAWVLLGAARCGTRPADGYEGAASASSCGSTH
jgi:hypothetical protein